MTILTLTLLILMMAEGVLTSGMTTAARLADMKVVKKLVTIPQAHFLWEVLISVQ